MSPGKRCFDVFWTTFGLLILWPLFVIIAIAVKCSDSGPVFYRQERVGKDGKHFRIWKFRTMVANADSMGRLITVGEDARITPVGQLLRKLKLDELPQLLNVLSGEMSLVGPRPEVPRYVALYSDEQRRVLQLTPGITDLASIQFRRESDILALSNDPDATYIHEIMPQKLLINLEYAQHASVWYDLGIILKTIRAIFR